MRALSQVLRRQGSYMQYLLESQPEPDAAKCRNIKGDLPAIFDRWLALADQKRRLSEQLYDLVNSRVRCPGSSLRHLHTACRAARRPSLQACPLPSSALVTLRYSNPPFALVTLAPLPRGRGDWTSAVVCATFRRAAPQRVADACVGRRPSPTCRVLFGLHAVSDIPLAASRCACRPLLPVHGRPQAQDRGLLESTARVAVSSPRWARVLDMQQAWPPRLQAVG